MAYRIAFTRSAAKVMKKLPQEVYAAVWKELEKIAKAPFAYHPKVTRLKNTESFRLRIGGWRVIYIIQKEKVIILVLKIGSRGEVYR